MFQPGTPRKSKEYRWPGPQPSPADSPLVAGHIAGATIQLAFKVPWGCVFSHYYCLFIHALRGRAGKHKEWTTLRHGQFCLQLADLTGCAGRGRLK